MPTKKTTTAKKPAAAKSAAKPKSKWMVQVREDGNTIAEHEVSASTPEQALKDKELKVLVENAYAGGNLAARVYALPSGDVALTAINPELG